MGGIEFSYPNVWVREAVAGELGREGRFGRVAGIHTHI